MNFTDPINIHHRTEYWQGSNVWQSLAETGRNLTLCPLNILVLKYVFIFLCLKAWDKKACDNILKQL